VTTAFVLKHFNSIREAILKTDFLNYVNDKVLSQYDDEEILHSVIFYSKNMIFAECNYEIYDKELLTIICCLKHWCLELKCTDISIKIFINYLNLSTLWSAKNWLDDKLNELRSYLNITFKLFISQKNRIWKSTRWLECQMSSQFK